MSRANKRPAVAETMRQAGARDSRLSTDAVIGAVRLAIAAWVLAVDGDETALPAVAEPQAALTGSGQRQLTSGQVDTLDHYLGCVFTSRKETPDEYRKRTGSVEVPRVSGGGASVPADVGFCRARREAWFHGVGRRTAGDRSDTRRGYAEYCTGSTYVSPNPLGNEYESACLTTPPTPGAPGWFHIGGTSLSAPLFGALFADRDAFQGHRSGAANYLLYRLFDNSRTWTYTVAFHDITALPLENNNGFFPVTPAYDEATGIGTPNFTALITG